MSCVFRIEYPKKLNRTTKMMIAAPLVDSVSVGIMTVLEEIGVRLESVVVGGIRPIDFVTHEDEATNWEQASSNSEVFELDAHEFLDMLELLNLSKDQIHKLRQELESTTCKVYEFKYETDFRIFGVGRDKLNNRVLSAILELCARRQPLSGTIDDHCGL